MSSSCAIMAARALVRKIISTAAAARPAGPYSQAIQVENTVYIAGQVGMRPKSQTIVEGGVVAEAEQVMQNVQAIVTAAGGNMDNVVKTTLLLCDIADLPKVNEVYTKYFPSGYPARLAYCVKALPVGAKVEMEAIAILGTVSETV